MEKRVQFDFAIEFTNGGGIQGQDFRLDIAGETISDPHPGWNQARWLTDTRHW